MHGVHAGENLVLNVLHHKFVLVCDKHAASAHGHSAAQKLGKAGLNCLIVNNLALLAAALLSFELAADAAVARSVTSSLD